MVPLLSKSIGLIRAGFGLVSYFWRKIIVKTTFELLFRVGSGGLMWVRLSSGGFGKFGWFKVGSVGSYFSFRYRIVPTLRKHTEISGKSGLFIIFD